MFSNLFYWDPKEGKCVIAHLDLQTICLQKNHNAEFLSTYPVIFHYQYSVVDFFSGFCTIARCTLKLTDVILLQQN